MRIKLFREYLSTEEKKAKKLRFFFQKSNNGCVQVDKSELYKYDIPDAIKSEMMKWDSIFKSPHSESFYDSDEFKINSDTGAVVVGKPDGLYRVSDHWNYTSFRDNHEQKHSQTNVPVLNNTHVTLAKYDKPNRKFVVILSEPSDKHLKDTAEKKRVIDYLKDPNTIAKKRNFKEKIDNREVIVAINDTKSGILTKWNGRELKAVDKDGELIFSSKDASNRIGQLKFFINNVEVEDPYGYE